MITAASAMLCGIMLIAAGMLELIRGPRADKIYLWAARLSALGFFVLGARILYLVHDRAAEGVHIISIFSVAVIAAARIIACANAMLTKRRGYHDR